MALDVKELPREFKFKHEGKDVVLDDPNPSMSAKEVLDLFSGQYPELVNASVGESVVKDDKLVFDFNIIEGRKG